MALLLLSSCAVPIKNQRWYADEGALGAHYFETLTTVQGDISKAEWDQMRFGMACTSVKTLAEIKAEIEKLCSATRCKYEDVKKILNKFETTFSLPPSQYEEPEDEVQ